MFALELNSFASLSRIIVRDWQGPTGIKINGLIERFVEQPVRVIATHPAAVPDK
jgi:hypothetical protein